MPYRHAYLCILLLFPAVGLAFWPSYFGRLGQVSWILHAHGLTASLWIALLAAQSWSIQGGAPAVHRASGRASLALFPLFWLSGLLIVQVMARGFVTHDGLFHTLYGARLTTVDLLASAGVLYLYHLALVRRRAVVVHASAMLAILLFLLPPIVVRLLQIAGPFAIHSAAEAYKFGLGLEAANLFSIAVALWLYLRRPRQAWPFLVTAGIIGLQSLAFETLGRSAAWEKVMPKLASLPTAGVAGLALTVSALLVWRGWIRVGGDRKPRREAAASLALN